MHDKKEKEQTLENSSITSFDNAELYKGIVDSFDGQIYICSLDCTIEYMNGKLIAYCGKDCTGQPCYVSIHKRTTRCEWCVIDKIAKGETVRREMQHPVDGTWHYLIESPVYRNAIVVGKQTVVIDITERKNTIAQLLAGEQRYRDLANLLPLTIFEFDLDGKFTYVNPTGLQWFGYTQKEIDQGFLIQDTVVESDRLRATENLRCILSGDNTKPNEYEGLRKNGTTFPVLIHCRPILKEKDIVGIRGIAVDLSEHVLMTKALNNAEKLEALGILAGGIAHDFNNLLTGIFGYIQLASMPLSAESDTKKDLAQALSVFNRAKNLTQQLLTFAKGGTPVKKVVSIATLLSDAAKFALSGSTMSLELNLDTDLWIADVDEYQITQVFDNLIINARQAIGEGGKITVTAKNVQEHDVLPKDLAKKRYIKLSFKDNGPGILPENISKVFDPFFTTKSHGSGLGLATAYSIIKKHEGIITVVSKPGTGAEFIIYLPAVNIQNETVSFHYSIAQNTNTYAILVMDDEKAIREFSGAILQAKGHSVVLAHEGKQAVELYKKAIADAKPFDIVVLDLTVQGGMGGLDTIQELLKVNSDVVAIATSGYSNDPILAQPHKNGFAASLSKPFLAENLYRIIDEVLAK